MLPKFGPSKCWQNLGQSAYFWVHSFVFFNHQRPQPCQRLRGRTHERGDKFAIPNSDIVLKQRIQLQPATTTTTTTATPGCVPARLAILIFFLLALFAQKQNTHKSFTSKAPKVLRMQIGKFKAFERNHHFSDFPKRVYFINLKKKWS